MKSSLLFLCISFCLNIQAQVTTTKLCGIPLDQFPHFNYLNTQNNSEDLYISIDPFKFPYLSLDVVNVYVVEHKTSEQWGMQPELVDVRLSGAQSLLFNGSSLQDNSTLLIAANSLEIEQLYIGSALDVVLDVNKNGVLDHGDIIDTNDQKPGVYVIQDISVNGFFSIVENQHNGGARMQQKFYYPANVNELDKLPLLIMAHGWTYNNDAYDFLGRHLASYGYVVAGINNNTLNGSNPATEQSSIDIINNVDYIFENQNTILSGVLNGHIDFDNIAFAGHSTGGEAVVRAYNRLLSAETTSLYIDHTNVKLVISLAPVAFLSDSNSNMHQGNYALFVGGADTDASGLPQNNYTQTFSLYERAIGNKHAFYIHGAGHEDFADSGLEIWSYGPNELDVSQGNTITKTYVLALSDYYLKNNQACFDYISKSFTEFQPQGFSEQIIITNEYKAISSADIDVIDDFQTNSDPLLSSSGAVVTTDISSLNEILMKDHDGSFNWTGSQWSNGMSRARYGDNPRCLAFQFDAPKYLTYQFEETKDWSSVKELTFRVAQLTRHPNTLELDDNLDFTISIEDDNGVESNINFAAYNQFATSPYKRSNGGVLNLCLPAGSYQAVVHGGLYPYDQEFLIPGYVSLTIGPGTSSFYVSAPSGCSDVQVLMYNPYCYGWDFGYLEILNSSGELMGTSTLGTGCEPDHGFGWQNEFQSIHIPLGDFDNNGSSINLNAISKLSFEFGSSSGSPIGAIAIDDISVNTIDQISSYINIDELSVTSSLSQIYPNPTSDVLSVIVNGVNVYDLQLFDVNGRLVYNEKSITTQKHIIRTDNLSPGIYNLVIGKNATEHFKIVVY